MTAEEAIKLLNPDTREEALNEIEINGGEIEAGMKAFDEACIVAIEALEKQIPKKPVRKNPICYCKKTNGEEYYAYYYYCPVCGTKLTLWEHHCACGQAIDWSDGE